MRTQWFGLGHAKPSCTKQLTQPPLPPSPSHSSWNSMTLFPTRGSAKRSRSLAREAKHSPSRRSILLRRAPLDRTLRQDHGRHCHETMSDSHVVGSVTIASEERLDLASARAAVAAHLVVVVARLGTEDETVTADGLAAARAAVPAVLDRAVRPRSRRRRRCRCRRRPRRECGSVATK